jgi:hypothetical protein
MLAFVDLAFVRDAQPLRLGDLARCVPKGERLILSRLKAAKMTPAQIAEAQRMAGEWKPK